MRRVDDGDDCVTMFQYCRQTGRQVGRRQILQPDDPQVSSFEKGTHERKLRFPLGGEEHSRMTRVGWWTAASITHRRPPLSLRALSVPTCKGLREHNIPIKLAG